MKLSDHFNRFCAEISLNPDRKARIDSAYSNLESLMWSDEEISNIARELFRQGSYAIGTAVKPLKSDQEFDVDVVLALNIHALPRDQRSPRAVIEWLAQKLRQNSCYKGKVQRRDRCVRLNYTGDFHVDIVPAHCPGDVNGILLIPDQEAEEKDWSETHPKGYMDWCAQMQDASNGKFTRVVKMLKWWRNLKFGKDTAPKSILLTTLIGHHIAQGCSSDAEALVLTMESLNVYLRNPYLVPVIPNPSLANENLARDWTQEQFELFKERFEAATQMARQAYDEEDKGQSISLWRKVFGDAFPKLTTGEAKRIEAIARAGAGYVTSKGTVTSEQPDELHVPIPPHRYYGDNDS